MHNFERKKYFIRKENSKIYYKFKVGKCDFAQRIWRCELTKSPVSDIMKSGLRDEDDLEAN